MTWPELNLAWEQWWAELAARTRPLPLWYTPERARRISALLQRGADWLATQPAATDRERYLAHLRRLQPLLRTLQSELGQTSQRLLAQHSQLQARRAWANSQPHATKQ